MAGRFGVEDKRPEGRLELLKTHLTGIVFALCHLPGNGSSAWLSLV